MAVSPEDPDAMRTRSSRVSFIVPTRNSAETIGACARAIRRQTHPDIELIVVDNTSTDATRAIAEGLADQLLNIGPERSAQRNAGARAASGDFLVFLDSDMIAAPELAADVVRVFDADPGVHALVIPERSIGRGFWAECRSLEKELYLGDPDVEAARVFRRDAFFAAHGYDERIHGGGEDWDLPERIVDRGGRIARTSADVVHDEGRMTLMEDLRQKFYYGRTFGRYISKDRGRAARKVVRLSLLHGLPLLMRTPLLAGGLVLMKSLELTAVLAGIGYARMSRHPAERIP